MKASDELTKKPRIDVRHMIDHNGLAVALGYAFKVSGNEDGSGGDGDGGAGPDSGGPGSEGPGSEGPGESTSGVDQSGRTGTEGPGEDRTSIDQSVSPEEAAANVPAGQRQSDPDPTDEAPLGFDTPPDENDPTTQFDGIEETDPDPDRTEADARGMAGEPVDSPVGIDAGAPRDEQPMPARPFDFETRGREVRRRALGAGAQRSDNMADLLGYVPTRKARGQARAVLGGR